VNSPLFSSVLLCLLANLTFVGPPSLCLLVLRNTRTQVSQGRSTYAEAKVLNTSASPPPVVDNPSHLSPLVLEFVGGTGSDTQLLHLRQGPCQRIDDFLAQFKVLKVQSRCVDNYAMDLLERVLQRKLLEQIYIQNMRRDTYAQLSTLAREIGRAQELFLINMQSQGTTWYFQGQNYSLSSASTSSTPMDIGATDAQVQQRDKGPQCYNCQLFGHITRECTKPHCPRHGQQQAQAVQAQPEDDQLNAVRGMTFAEMQAFFKDLKD